MHNFSGNIKDFLCQTIKFQFLASHGHIVKDNQSNILSFIPVDIQIRIFIKNLPTP